MTDTSLNSPNPYRWIILIVLSFAMMMMNTLQFQIAGLANRIIPALNLKPDQFAMILSAPMLTASIFGILAGVLADRFGVKNVITVGLVIATFGSFFRINADSFALLFIWNFLIGFGLAFLNSNGAKILGVWFPREQMGAAMGMFIASTSVGIALGQATPALFPTVNATFTTSAIITFCALVLWVLFGKSKPAGVTEPPPQPIKEYLRVVAGSKNIWIAGIAMMVLMGTIVTHTGNLPIALIQGKGVSPVEAGMAAASMSLAFIVGSIIGPVISAKIGLTKPFLAPMAFITAVISYCAWIVPYGVFTWILLVLSGIFLGSTIPLIMSSPILLPEIGPVYAGCAGGILSTLQMAGAFVIPAYIVMQIAGSQPNNLLICISVGYLISGVIMLLIPELGLKARLKDIA